MDDTHSPPATDLLTGLEEIAAYCGWTVRQTKHRAAAGELPTFRLGSGRTVFARRSTLAKHFAAQEEAASGSVKE